MVTAIGEISMDLNALWRLNLNLIWMSLTFGDLGFQLLETSGFLTPHLECTLGASKTKVFSTKSISSARQIGKKRGLNEIIYCRHLHNKNLGQCRYQTMMTAKVTKDCWHYILGYILKPEDLHSLINTGSPFPDMLHSRMMSELIAPALLKSLDLPKPTLLSLRAVNKGMKYTIDAFLHKTEPEWLLESCTFSAERPRQMDKFRIQFAAHVLRGSLLPKYFTLQVSARGPGREESVAFLRNLSCKISNISIRLEVEDIDIGRVPNVEHDHAEFPRLPQLRDLKLCSYAWHGGWRSIKYMYELLIETYASQLEKLAFLTHTWHIVDLDEQTFPNLRYLGIFDFMEYSERNNDAFEKLSMIKAPNLHCLDLGYGGVAISTPFLSALQNFQGSLQELRLPRLFWESRQLSLGEVNPFTLKTLAELKKLVVDTGDLESGVWFLFPFLFPNLEEIKFDMGRDYGGEDYPAQNVNMLRKMFGRFNRLKRLIWVRYMGPSKVTEKVVFNLT